MTKMMALTALSLFLIQCTSIEKDFEPISENFKNVYTCKESQFALRAFTKLPENKNLSSKAIYNQFLKHCAELALENGYEQFRVENSLNPTPLGYGKFHEELKKGVSHPLGSSAIDTGTTYKATELHDTVESYNFD